MTAYLVSAFEIHDREEYGRYIELAREALAKAKFRRLSSDPDPIIFEGEKPGNHHMIAEFDSIEDIQAFYHSEAYQNAVRAREKAATVKYLMAMKGIEA